MLLTNMEDGAKGFWNKNRNAIIVGIVALLLFPAGYLTGKFANPTKVVEKTVIQEKLVDKIVYQDKIVEKIVYVQAKKEKTHTETITVQAPDGTKTTKTSEDTSTDTDTKVDQDKKEEVVKTEVKIVEKVVEKLKIVESARPGWRISAGAGVAIPVFLGHEQMGVPGLQGAVINAEVSRRVVGPFWAGLHANTMGVFGLSVGGEF